MSFLDNVSSSINRGIAGASRTAESVKLKSRLNDINNQRQSLSAQLGASLYGVTKGDAGFRTGREPLYNGIAQLDAQRDEIQLQIAQLEEQARASELAARTYTCPNCNGKISETDLFCAGCGTPIDLVRASATSAMEPGRVLCPKCGGPMGANDVFCMSCGSNIEEYNKQSQKLTCDAAGEPERATVPGNATTPMGSICPSCGQPVTLGEDVFCPNCGVRLD